MITKIDRNGIVTCAPYGFAPGKYPIEEFTADDLLTERRILNAYMMAHPIQVYRALDDLLAREIDKKFDKNGLDERKLRREE